MHAPASHPALAGVLVETAPAGSARPGQLVDRRLELRLHPVDHVPGVGHIVPILGLDVLLEPARIIPIVTHIGCDGLVQRGCAPQRRYISGSQWWNTSSRAA